MSDSFVCINRANTGQVVVFSTECYLDELTAQLWEALHVG
jgi:hypothetical protein